jgi:uncharacterized membrane protein
MKQERQDKKELFAEPKKKGAAGTLLAVAGLLVVIAAVAGWLLTGQDGADGYTVLKADNGEVRIALAEVSDGQAHYFTHSADGTDVDFFVVKSVDGVVRSAFDACDVCFHEKKGYRQEGNFMVCNNCDMQFRTDLINEVKGGCNPAPLDRRIEGEQMVITTADIAGGRRYFN